MSANQSFDQWVRDEGGPEAVVAMVEDVERQADEGLLPGFTDKEEFLTHLVRRGRRSACPGKSSNEPPPSLTSKN